MSTQEVKNIYVYLHFIALVNLYKTAGKREITGKYQQKSEYWEKLFS